MILKSDIMLKEDETMEEVLSLKRTLSYISHEMLNILTVMMYSAKTIENDNEEIKKNEHWNYLTKDMKYMTDVLKDLAIYNHSKEPVKRKCHIDNLLENVVNEMKNRYKDDAEIKYEYEEGEYFAVADECKIKQVFVNIIKNAVEATSGVERGCVKVGIKREKKWITVYCIDNGCGIKKENIEKIFIEGVSINKKDGSGLGLSISKNIIESHGGSISVNTTPEHETVFKLNIPFN